MNKPDIRDLTKSALQNQLTMLGEGAYRARQVFRWLYGAGASSFDQMTDIPAPLKEELRKDFRINHLTILDSKRSSLDGTTKYLLKLCDSNTIETVFLPAPRRGTVCVSSQVGCKYGCSFCASAPLGFVRNLTQSEIAGQVITAKQKNPYSQITNLVFMGIGEPFDNYDNVLASIRVFNDRDAFNIGARKITISTCGFIPGIEKLAKEALQVELSVSLHSADDGIRSKIAPINKKYPIKELIAVCKDYIKKTNRVITFEYVLIKDLNSSRQAALKLAGLLKGIKCKVNTISCNRAHLTCHDGLSEKEAGVFTKTLKAKGINAVNRKLKGGDIEAACGQLRISRL